MRMVLSGKIELKKVTTTPGAGITSGNKSSVDESIIAAAEEQQSVTRAEALCNEDIDDDGSRDDCSIDDSECPDRELSDDDSGKTDESSGYGSDNSVNESDGEHENHSISLKGATLIKHEVLALLREDSSISIETWKRVRELLKATSRIDKLSLQESTRPEPAAKVLKGSSVEGIVGEKLGLKCFCVGEKSLQAEPEGNEKFDEFTERRFEVLQGDIFRSSATSVGNDEGKEVNHFQAPTVMRSFIAGPINIKREIKKRRETSVRALHELGRMAVTSLIRLKPESTWKHGSLSKFFIADGSPIGCEKDLFEMKLFETKSQDKLSPVSRVQREMPENN